MSSRYLVRMVLFASLNTRFLIAATLAWQVLFGALGLAQAQTFSLGYFPLSDARHSDLDPRAFQTSLTLSLKPVLTQSLAQKIGTKSLSDIARSVHHLYIEVNLDQQLPMLSTGDPLAALSGLDNQGLLVLLAIVANPSDLGKAADFYQTARKSSPSQDLIVLVSLDDEASVSESAQTIRRLLQGFGDRHPFGNQDKVLSVNEAQAYLSRSEQIIPGLLFARATTETSDRLVDLANLVNHDGRDELEFQRELAEVKFAMALSEHEELDAYLNGCQFCPFAQEALSLLDRQRRLEAQRTVEVGIATQVLQSKDSARLKAYLQTCQVCPKTDEVETAIVGLAKERKRQSENSQWLQAVEQSNNQDIESYLASCQICEFSSDAKRLLKQLAAKETEQALWQAIQSAPNLANVETYLAECLDCEFEQQAKDFRQNLTQDLKQLSENSAVQRALTENDKNGLKTYILTCEFCEQRALAQTRLEALRQETQTKIKELMQSCRLLAPPTTQLPNPIEQSTLNAALQDCRSVIDLDDNFIEARALAARALIVHQDLEAAAKVLALNLGSVRNAEQTYPHALTLQAWLLANSNPEHANKNQSIRLYKRAAAQEELFASLALLTLFAAGDDLKFTPDEVKAIAEQSTRNQYPDALMAYARLILQIGGSPSEKEQAISHLFNAAAQGQAEAAGQIARLFERGEGLRRSSDNAATFFVEALLGGDQATANYLTDRWFERSSDLIKAVQNTLAQEDLFKGDVDGIYGPKTRDAIRDLATANQPSNIRALGLPALNKPTP